MLNNSPTIPDLIDSRIMYALGDLHTALPSKVVAYDHTRQCVDIQPLLRKEYSNKYVVEMPVVKGVPLVFQGSSTSLISFPIKQDDIVLAIFCEKSLDKWVNSDGSFVTPASGVMFDLSDCFAIPGLQTFRTHENPNPDNLEVRFNTNTAQECSVKMYQNGNITLNSPKDITVNASDNVTVNTTTATINASSDVKVDTPDTRFTGNVNINGGLSVDGTTSSTGSIDTSGAITTQGINLTSHTHTGDSGGTTSGPQ